MRFAPRKHSRTRLRKCLNTNRDALCCSLAMFPDDELGREALWAERHRLLNDLERQA